MDHSRFNNLGEGVGEVDSNVLSKATDHQSCFVALKRTIGAGLVAEHPFAYDDVGVRGPRHKLPHAVTLQRVELLLYHGEPARVARSSTS